MLLLARPFSLLCCDFSSYDRNLFFCLSFARANSAECHILFSLLWINGSLILKPALWGGKSSSQVLFSATGSGDSSLLCLFLKGVTTLLFFPRVSPWLSLFGRCRKQRLVAWAAFGEGKGPVSSSATLARACLLCKGLL